MCSGACSNGEADCVDQATCIDSFDGERFICACPDGLMGDGRTNGSGCMPDECSANADCTEIAACVNSADGFICLCPSGFFGDGRVNGSNCIPDECSTIADCDDLASCTDTIDGFVCTCQIGFTGNGRINGSGCIGKHKISVRSMDVYLIKAYTFMGYLSYFLSYLEYLGRNVGEAVK